MDTETAVALALPVFSTTRLNDWSGLRAGIAQTGVPAALAAEVADGRVFMAERDLRRR